LHAFEGPTSFLTFLFVFFFFSLGAGGNWPVNKILNNNNYDKWQEMTDLAICVDHESNFNRYALALFME
jgi:hypothetical protein